MVIGLLMSFGNISTSVLFILFFQELWLIGYLLSYFDRLGRSSVGYGGSRSSMSSSQDSHGLYGSRQGMGYGGGVSLVAADLLKRKKGGPCLVGWACFYWCFVI